MKGWKKLLLNVNRGLKKGATSIAQLTIILSAQMIVSQVVLYISKVIYYTKNGHNYFTNNTILKKFETFIKANLSSERF